MALIARSVTCGQPDSGHRLSRSVYRANSPHDASWSQKKTILPKLDSLRPQEYEPIPKSRILYLAVSPAAFGAIQRHRMLGFDVEAPRPSDTTFVTRASLDGPTFLPEWRLGVLENFEFCRGAGGSCLEIERRLFGKAVQ